MTVTGHSKTFSFEEAIKDALSKMPKPAHPDVAKVAEVILIRAVESGHMAPGLYITVK